MATKKTYNVDATFIKQAHKVACDDWKKRLETKFPEVFKSKEVVYAFRDGFRLTSNWNGPLIIGHGLAPRGLEGKCLVVSSSYKVEVKTQGDTQFLVFKKVKRV